LYKLKIQDNEKIEPFFIENTKHVGSYNEIFNNKEIILKNKLRVCFDLDNTLVTYPTVIGDYSTVKPIYKNIKLLNNLKNDGHEIIIYTARRMATHKSNIGKVIKDIANVTINTLEQFDIQYDELIFGKPLGDGVDFAYYNKRDIVTLLNDKFTEAIDYHLPKRTLLNEVLIDKKTQESIDELVKLIQRLDSDVNNTNAKAIANSVTPPTFSELKEAFTYTPITVTPVSPAVEPIQIIVPTPAPEPVIMYEPMYTTTLVGGGGGGGQFDTQSLDRNNLGDGGMGREQIAYQ
jgi:capsule biosynthesis phosphatase